MKDSIKLWPIVVTLVFAMGMLSCTAGFVGSRPSAMLEDLEPIPVTKERVKPQPLPMPEEPFDLATMEGILPLGMLQDIKIPAIKVKTPAKAGPAKPTPMPEEPKPRSMPR